MKRMKNFIKIARTRFNVSQTVSVCSSAYRNSEPTCARHHTFILKDADCIDFMVLLHSKENPTAFQARAIPIDGD
jgi:uncharacterized protein (DUF1778 family)